MSRRRRWARGHKWARRLALVALAAGAGLLLAELGLRGLAPQPLVRLRPDIWVPEEGLGWKRAGNLDTVVNTGAGDVRLRTDDQGHRIAAAESSPPRYRILALGDSFVAGLQVEAPQSLTEGLGSRLSERLGKPVTVVNTAVSGWGPEQYLEVARRELARASYDFVVVFLFVGNDTLEEVRPSISPQAPFPHRSLRWPRRVSWDEWVDALAYPINDALERRSHLYVASRRALRSPLMKMGLSASQLPPVFLETDPEAQRWEVTAHLCRAIADVAQDAGAGSLFVLLPGVYQVDPVEGERFLRSSGLAKEAINFRFANDRLLLALRLHGLVASDPTPTLQRATRRGEALYGRADTHLNAQGHEAIATYVAPQVAALIEFQETSVRPGQGSP